MLVVRNMGEVPAALARNEGPYASGYVLPDPSTLGTPAKKKPAAIDYSWIDTTGPTSSAPLSALASLRKTLEGIPLVVWICIGLGTVGAIMYASKKGGRRKGGRRPFGRTGRRR